MLHEGVRLRGHDSAGPDHLVLRGLPGLPQPGKRKGLTGLEEDVGGYLLLAFLGPIKETVGKWSAIQNSNL